VIRPAPLACLALAACSLWSPEPQALPINVFFADARDLANVRRVVVLPFTAAAGLVADTGLVRAAFLDELTKLQRFEVVPLPEAAPEDERLYRSLERGRLSTQDLVELGARYRVDGLILGTVTSWRPYLPPHLGLRVHLLSIHSATQVWAAEGLYDAADGAVREDLEEYAATFAAEEASLHGSEIHLISPRKFARYVCHRLAGTWR
jgi:hypothetical protein